MRRQIDEANFETKREREKEREREIKSENGREFAKTKKIKK